MLKILSESIYQIYKFTSGIVSWGLINGADVKIMDRFFRHRELPDSENFSKPGFQLKTA